MLLLFSVSCQNDNFLNDKEGRRTTSLSNQEFDIRFNSEQNMFVVRGNGEGLKKFLYEEEWLEKRKDILLDAYHNGFNPLTTYGEIEEGQYIEFSNKFEEIKEAKSLDIMSNLDYISEEEIAEHGIDIDNSTFINDNNFASVLNYNGQIQINDSIYMYTPKGLFISDINSKRRLEGFLQENQTIEVGDGLSVFRNGISAYKPVKSKLTPYEIRRESMYFPNNVKPNKDNEFNFPENTSFYSDCAGNAHKPLFPNLFGASHTCYHEVTSEHRVKSVFKVQDFKIFNNTILKTLHERKKMQSTKIKIWPFKIKINWVTYWENASADLLYTKINSAYFELVREDETISFTDADVKSALTYLSNLLKPTNNTTQPEGFLMMNDEYILNSLGTYNNTNYQLKPSDINNINNYYGGVLYPSNYIKTPNVNKTDIDALHFLRSNRKKIILNLTLYSYSLKVSDQDIMNKIGEVLNGYVTKGYNKDDIAIVLNEMNLQNVPQNHLKRTSTKIFVSEVLTAKGTHKLLKDFNIPKDFKLEGFKLGFIKTDNKSTISLGIDYSTVKVSKFHIDFETGAYFRGKWGGIKYSVAE